MKINRISLLAGSLALLGTNAYADPPSVVASIKPVHSLVAGVMQGIGTPSLIVEGGGSPHTYSLRPSNARALQNADVIFWVGPGMETFLDRPIDSLGDKARVVSLMEAHGLQHVSFREGGPFEAHAHDDHGEEGHDDHKDHGHDDHKDHGHDDPAEDKHDDHKDHAHGDHAEDKHDDHKDHAEDKHDDHKDHAHGDDDKHGHDNHKDHAHGDDNKHGHDDHGDERDAHIWLDPENAKALAHEIAEVLGEADPENATRYEANADALMKRIDGLSAELRQTLEPVHERRFIVFHDAYQHFERRFDLRAAGSITVSPEVIPGAERVADIRHKVEDLGATCVFSEPQFTPRLVNVVTEGTAAKSGVLDPLGSEIPDGPDLWFTLMQNMASSIRTCLTPTG